MLLGKACVWEIHIPELADQQVADPVPVEIEQKGGRMPHRDIDGLAAGCKAHGLGENDRFRFFLGQEGTRE